MKPSTYSCSFPDCQHSYRTNEKLEKHQKTHEGQDSLKQKLFTCSVCERILTTKQSLTEHLFTHKEKKLFRCSEVGCGRKFKQYSQLCNHRKLHRLAKINTDERIDMTKNLPAIENNFNLSEISNGGLQMGEKIVLPAITNPVFGVSLPGFNSMFLSN